MSYFSDTPRSGTTAGVWGDIGGINSFAKLDAWLAKEWSWRQFFTIILPASVGLALAFSAGMLAYATFFVSEVSQEASDMESVGAMLRALGFLNLFKILALAAAKEEALFRVLALTPVVYFFPRFALPAAVLASGLFSLSHGLSYNIFFIQFILGMFLSIVFIKSGREGHWVLKGFVATTVAHLCYNVTNLGLGFIISAMLG